jgi:hypothetical protein
MIREQMVMFLLIPIGLLMAIVIVIFLLSVTTIVRFRRRHGITQPLMWWDDPAALKTGASDARASAGS